MAVYKATVILFLSLLAFSSALTVPVEYKPCKDVKEYGKLSSVDINPCPELPCVFHKGTNVTAKIKFTPSVTVTNGTLETYGIIGGFRVKFPLPQPKACTGHNLKCPLKAGQEYTLIITLAIQKVFPDTELVAQMDFKLPDNNDVFCFQFPAKIAE
ncbi:NPC intracellular cholesterol transporter 2-like [Oculina patagonica]